MLASSTMSLRPLLQWPGEAYFWESALSPFSFKRAPLFLSPCNKPTLGLLGSVTPAWQGATQAIHSMFSGIVVEQ